ncbi:DUF952 domain-containing protein [Ferrimonas gelatinilytica]|uniref:DUF952 domain-containing protein n=1 Tax=Ferrimonas gelatinilytica TaxID=1255257 RepID=A0ABP9S340_9GAMM
MQLYRVVSQADWQEALRTGLVPRCGSDQRAGWIHLNTPEDVETVAARYFSPKERPLALLLDLTEQQANLSWLAPTEAKPWRQPILSVPQLQRAWVVAVRRLEPSGESPALGYRLGEALPLSRKQQRLPVGGVVFCGGVRRR